MRAETRAETAWKACASIQATHWRQCLTAPLTAYFSTPPYQTDFAVAKRLITRYLRVEIGGKLFMVTKRKAWYLNKLISVFGGAHVQEVDGYFVFGAERRMRQYAQK